MPGGFSLVEPRANDRVRYSCAISAQDARLEIRYHIVSLKPQPLPPGFTSIAAADMNQLHVPNLLAIIQNVADRVIADPNLLPADAVRAEFGADWGATCRLGLARSSFSEGFTECLLLALHRKDVADAYVFFMFEDFASTVEILQSNFYTLTFEPGAAKG